jgi:pimeloyl-ACP methyl ester carboxylesterase
MSTPLEEIWFRINGIRLHAIQSGPADGPLLILLHGFPEFWYGWQRHIAPLAQAGFHVLVPDQRGYNLSDCPKGISSYSTEKLVADVIGLIDASGREKAFLAGHDWGAAVAWETALRYPQRLEKLAILNVPHLDVMLRFLRSDFQQMRKSWYIFFFQLPWLPEALLRAGNYNGAAQMLVRSALPNTFTPEDISEYKKAWSQPGALTGMINWYRAAFGRGLPGLWSSTKSSPRRVAVPTLILWGKNDAALSDKMAQPSLDLCDDGQLVFFENATHWVQHDEAKAVTHHLLEFFQKP